MADYEVLVFDLDGTLVDSFPGILSALNLALSDFQMPPVDLGWVRKHVGRGASRLIASASGGRVEPSELHHVFRKHYGNVVVEGSRPFPGVEAALDELAAQYALAIASNKPDVWVHQIIDALGWEARFSCVLGPDEAGRHKPDPAMITRILEKTTCTNAEALLIGDMPVDVETGRNAGVSVVGVLTGAATARELMEAGCCETLRGVPDLPGWLKKRTGGCA